jgi:hypothetical protein
MGSSDTNDLIWGCANIGREVGGLSHRKVKSMLQTGEIPGNLVGDKWVASRTLIRKKLLGALEDKRR